MSLRGLQGAPITCGAINQFEILNPNVVWNTPKIITHAIILD